MREDKNDGKNYQHQDSETKTDSVLNEEVTTSNSEFPQLNQINDDQDDQNTNFEFDDNATDESSEGEGPEYEEADEPQGNGDDVSEGGEGDEPQGNGDDVQEGGEGDEPEEIDIEPITMNPRRWAGLGRNSTDVMQHIFEFVDNSIAHHVPDVPLRVDISLYQNSSVDGTTYTQRAEIKDNASGISPEILSQALMPDAAAGMWGEESGSEHGYGMKPALASLAEAPMIITKPLGLDLGYRLDTQKIQDLVNGNGCRIRLEDIEELDSHGTIIKLNSLTSGKGNKLGLKKKGTDSVKKLLGRLGQRYREVLKPGRGIFTSDDTSGIFVNVIHSNNRVTKTKVIPYSPIYFKCPITGSTGIPVENRTITINAADSSWSARIRIGLAPNKPHHFDEIPESKPGKFHPYKVSGDNAGFDIIHRNIVITYGHIPKHEYMDGIDRHGSTNNRIRGEIILDSGFTSTRTKDGPNEDEAWKQLMDELEDLLFRYTSQTVEEPVNLYAKLAWRSKKELTYTETMYVNQLKNKLSSLKSSGGRLFSGFPKVKSFTRDYEHPTKFGKPDITINVDHKTDEIMVEAKQAPAEGRHVYQLRAYMDANDCNFGIILAPGMADIGLAALEYLRKLKTWTGKKVYKIEHLNTAELATYSTELEESD